MRRPSPTYCPKFDHVRRGFREVWNLVADAETVKPAESLTDDPGLGKSLFEKGCEFVVHGASSEKREGTVPVGERYTPRGMEKPAKAAKVCCVSSG